MQPKQLQGTDLTIGQWLTAFHCYMDVYIQKFPNEVSGLLAYTNLIRDLERSCGQQTFNFMTARFGHIDRRIIFHGGRCMVSCGTKWL